MQVLEEGNPRIARFTFSIFHSENSSAPAFALNILNTIPPELKLVSSVTVRYTDGSMLHEESRNESDSIVELSYPRLLLDQNVTLEYLVQIGIDLPDGFNITNNIELQYTTIHQDGVLGVLVN